MVQSLEWKPGAATELIEFHRRAEAAQEGEKQFYNVADLIDDLRAGAFAQAAQRRDDARYEAAASAWLREHVPAPRLPLATVVQLRNGVQGVICNWSAYAVSRYEVAWFDRHFWQVRRKWFDRAQLIVIDAVNQTALA